MSSVDDGAEEAQAIGRLCQQEEAPPLETDRFDALTHTLSRMPSRRGVLGVLGGLSLAVLPGLADTAAERKKKKRMKKRCPPCPLTCAAICAGCCDADGICQAGAAAAACGTGGADCATCAAGHVCQDGNCEALFCTGKNECVASPARCENSGPECFCWVTTTGEPFCGQDASILNNCSQCTGAEVCIDASGPECGEQTACSLPCPNPL